MPSGLDGNPNPVVSAARTRVLELVASRAIAIDGRRPVLVGVDGASGSGKSTFADELAGVIAAATNRVVVRASIDSFHRPRAQRHELGADSAEGYYRDSHDVPALRQHLLDPFRTGSGTFRRGIFDEPADQPRLAVAEPVRSNATLLFDGLFLHRAELLDSWDLTVFLIADHRRAELIRRIPSARRARYVDGQVLYEREVAPQSRAGFVIDNDDLTRPAVLSP